MRDLHIPGFKGVLITEVLEDGCTLRIVRPFGFHSKTGVTFWAQEDDEVNGASIPRFFWCICGSPMVGRYRRAACIHDSEYLHKTHTRRVVDAGFLEIMLYEGVPRAKAWLMYAAVRLFGWSAW